MIIAFTVNNRPHYLRQTLESWSRVRGIGDCLLIFRCEPGCDEAVQVCREVDFARTITVCNTDRAGVLGNPWLAFGDAFTESEYSVRRAVSFPAGDFAILAEEDLIVSEDVLEYFSWCQRYREDPNVLGVTTYQHHEQPGGLAGVGPADWSRDDQFHFWAWGTWHDRWDRLLRDSWDLTYEDRGYPVHQRGWDWDFRNRLVVKAGMTMIAPSISRSQHIGRDGGVHCTPDQFDGLLAQGFVADVPPQDYQEI
jgi:hypothetical protein